MGVREVFEVLYSPVKAFKKIIEKPDFKGVLLILILVMSFTAVEQYVIASKLLLLDQTPDDDDWTESIAFWASNGLLSNDTDYKVGNYSVKSFVSNGTSIWMKIADIGPLDCSEDKGYKELFFWIRWTSENGSFPTSGATLRLFSGSESSYFERSLTSFISTLSDEWSNVTLKIGLEQSWNPTNSPDWKNITGLEFRLVWPASADLTLKIDGLHFRRYSSLLDRGVFSGSVASILMFVAIEFSMNWILWAGLLLLVAKFFREAVGPWTMFFIIIGHVFIVTVVYTIASAALISTLPPLNLPTKTWPPTTESEVNAVNALFEESWYPNLPYRLYTALYFITFSGVTIYFPLLREIWTLALCIIAIRLLRGITWGKAASISVVAFIIRSILRLFVGV